MNNNEDVVDLEGYVKIPLWNKSKYVNVSVIVSRNFYEKDLQSFYSDSRMVFYNNEIMIIHAPSEEDNLTTIESYNQIKNVILDGEIIFN